jgi:hypothetical protein
LCVCVCVQNSAFNLFDSFQGVGIDLRGIMQRQGIELHYVGERDVQITDFHSSPLYSPTSLSQLQLLAA